VTGAGGCRGAAAPSAGIVRAARRPPGWRAPGPPPAPHADAALGPRPGEDLCYLAGDWRILQQTAGHRWSLEDLTTAWVAATIARRHPPARFVDLGCGIGTVLMLLAWRFPQARGLGAEAQPASVDLARRSLAWNGAGERCAVVYGDLREIELAEELGAVDLVTGTPPYLTRGHATAPRRAQCGPCHFEERGGVEEYCAAAARLLAPDGRFVMCAAPFLDDRIVRGAAATGLTCERRVDVVPRAGKSRLFGVHAFRRVAAAPCASPLPSTLTVRDTRGQWTSAFAALRAAMGMPPRVD